VVTETDVTKRVSAAAFAGVVALAVMTGALLAASQQASGSQPVFRSQVNLVEVDATVVDGQGRFVPGLDAADFELLEDGVRQTIAFTQVVQLAMDAPEPLAAAATLAPSDVTTNATTFDGRLFVVVLDDLHITASRTTLARRLAREFVEHQIAPNDLTAVISTSGRAGGTQAFTADRALLVAAIDRAVGKKLISPGMATLANTAAPEAGRAENAAGERIFSARSTFEALGAITRVLKNVPHRRKALVLISEGLDYDVASQVKAMSGMDPGRESRDGLGTFINEANRANLTLYAFDPRVYTQGGDDFVDIASGPPKDTEDGSELVKSALVQDDLRTAQDNLRVLATSTGGFAATTSLKAVSDGFTRVRAEASNYYLLGYYPTREARDSHFRSIEIRCRRPGVTVHARRGYAPASVSTAKTDVSRIDTQSDASPALRDALSAPLPVSGFTLTASPVVFRGKGQNASVLVVVHADGAGVTFTPKGERRQGDVELAAVAIDDHGKTRAGQRSIVEMPLAPRLADFVHTAGVVLELRLDLPPGRYQLRVAGRDVGSGRVGTVHMDLEVADLSPRPVSMSGIVLTADQAGVIPAPKPDAQVQSMLRGTPITVRSFDASDRLTAAVEVYETEARRTDGKRAVAVSVVAADGRVVFRQEARVIDAAPKSAPGAAAYQAAIPLRGLARGTYALRFEAASNDPAAPRARRELRITVK